MDLVLVAGLVIIALAGVVALLVWAVRTMRPQVRTPQPPSALPTARRATQNHPHPTHGALVTRQVADEIESRLAQGNKIHAIKIYRDSTGVGLREAKDAIEAWPDGVSIAPRGFIPPAVPPTADVPLRPADGYGLTPDAGARIDRLVTDDRKIEAIKVYRESMGVGLKEAKDAIDAWVPGRGVAPQ